MSLEIVTVSPAEHAALQTVLADPALTDEYEMYAGDDGVARLLSTEYVPADAVHLARLDGEPIAFAFALLLPAERPWAMLRGFVRPHARRRGVGRALTTHLLGYLTTQTHRTDLVEIAVGAWAPHEAVRALLEPLAFRHERVYWTMERPRGAVPEPAWPTGVSVRTLAEGAALADWNEAYNRSFADHYRFVPSNVADCEHLMRVAHVPPDSVLVAYREDRVVGFCRTGVHGTRGAIDTLGVVPEARGLGLGRALLHWGVADLERRTTAPATLMVEGHNESALRLYREAGFAITRTRGLWARPWPMT